MASITRRVCGSIVCLAILGGCAPSVTVTPAGNPRQFEVTVSAQDPLTDTETLVAAWHKKSQETCNGQYKVISRDIVNTTETLTTLVITGLVECQ